MIRMFHRHDNHGSTLAEGSPYLRWLEPIERSQRGSALGRDYLPHLGHKQPSALFRGTRSATSRLSRGGETFAAGGERRRPREHNDSVHPGVQGSRRYSEHRSRLAAPEPINQTASYPAGRPALGSRWPCTEHTSVKDVVAVALASTYRGRRQRSDLGDVALRPPRQWVTGVCWGHVIKGLAEPPGHQTAI